MWIWEKWTRVTLSLLREKTLYLKIAEKSGILGILDFAHWFLDSSWSVSLCAFLSRVQAGR